MTAKMPYPAEKLLKLKRFIEKPHLISLSFKNIFKNLAKKRGALMQIMRMFFFSFSIVFVMRHGLKR